MPNRFDRRTERIRHEAYFGRTTQKRDDHRAEQVRQVPNGFDMRPIVNEFDTRRPFVPCTRRTYIRYIATIRIGRFKYLPDEDDIEEMIYT